MYKIKIVCPGTNTEIIPCTTEEEAKHALNTFLRYDKDMSDLGLLNLLYAGHYEVWHNGQKIGTFRADRKCGSQQHWD